MGVDVMTTRFAEIADSVNEIGENHWGMLSGNNFYSSYQWLRLCERDPSAQLRYLLALENGLARAAIPIHNVERETNPSYQWTSILANAGVCPPAGASYLLGTRRGYQSHFLSAAISPDDYERDISVLLDTAEHVAATAGVPNLVIPYLTTYDVLRIARLRQGIYPLHLGNDAWIELSGNDFEDYLAQLPSSRRRTVAYESRRFWAQNYQVTHTILGKCIQDASRLTAQTEARHGRLDDVAAIEKTYTLQADVMGERAEVLLLHESDKVIGFCLFYLHGGVMVLRTVGFDYKHLHGAFEYFNLTYYLPIREAYKRGARYVHAGLEASRAKALRGAVLKPLWLTLLGPEFSIKEVAQLREYNNTQMRQLLHQLDGIVGSVNYSHWEPFIP